MMSGAGSLVKFTLSAENESFSDLLTASSSISLRGAKNAALWPGKPGKGAPARSSAGMRQPLPSHFIHCPGATLPRGARAAVIFQSTGRRQ